MAIEMLTITVFLAAFIQGVKAGFVGALIGLAVGIGIGFIFRYGFLRLIKWMPQWLGLAGWIPIVIWPILCASCASLFTKLLLTVIY